MISCNVTKATFWIFANHLCSFVTDQKLVLIDSSVISRAELLVWILAFAFVLSGTCLSAFTPHDIRVVVLIKTVPILYSNYHSESYQN